MRATIMDVLASEWIAIETGEEEGLLERAHNFHGRLASIRVLDPACGTGNFLYVSMELMQALESRVIETIETLGGKAEPRVGPHQFYGLEKNPRAAKIAELVLWIGWLRNRLHDDPNSVPQPVLAESANINFGYHGGYDAVLRQDELGQPVLTNPGIPAWPEAEFIVGNPPFIGKSAGMRSALGNEYVEALWKANPRVPASADFVMQWWDRAANILIAPRSQLRRFGFVTTNSITQGFNRRVIANYLFPDFVGSRTGQSSQIGSPRDSTDRNDDVEREGVSLIMAIADHPWTKVGKDAAAVRIAMTAAERGNNIGMLVEVVAEAGLDTDKPLVDTTSTIGRINSDLSIGTDATRVQSLDANTRLSGTGMLLAGQGFKLTEVEARRLIALDGSSAATVIKPYVGGGELLGRPRHRFVVDFANISEMRARHEFPATYSHILQSVKPERDQNPQKSRREKWWLFGRSNAILRDALADVDRFILTTETAKHRIFQFRDASTIPDHMAISIALPDAYFLGVLSSSSHLKWALSVGGTLEDRPRYNKAICFDPYPFPDPTPGQRVAIADLAEELDATRKTAIAETDKLTMTELYNLRAKLRSGAAMDDSEQRRATKARAAIIDRLHEQLDQAVADAYSWGAEWRRAPLPPSEIVARLVKLNHERAAEEAAGQVRWLRPDYQVPRFAKAKKADPGSSPG